MNFALPMDITTGATNAVHLAEGSRTNLELLRSDRVVRPQPHLQLIHGALDT